MAEGFKLLDAYVEVHADGRGVADKVAEDINRESGGSSRLGRVGSGMGGNLLGGLRGAFTSGAVGGLVGGVVGSVTSGLTSIVGAAVSDISGMLLDVSKLVATTVIDYNSTLQNATIGFETMLGSGRKAKGFLDELQAFAKSTPFEFTDLVTSSQRLLAMGTNARDVIPYMTGIGDAVAGLGKGPEVINQVVTAIGQMTAKGKVQGDDLMQLTEAGIPALKILADSYGVSTSAMSDMISTGHVLASRAVPAIIGGLEKGTKSVKGFGGMMEKQSHTFSGALSNIKDAFTQTTAKAFKPFFDVASRGMERFATALSGKPADKFQKDMTRTLKPFAKEIEKWFKGIDFNKIFTGASDGIKKMFKGVDPKTFGKDLKGFGKDAKDIFDGIVRIAPRVGKVMKEAGPAIKETIKQGVAFIGWIADVLDWFDKTEKGWYKWRAEFVKGFDGFFADADKFWHDVGAGWDGFWADLGASIAHGWDQIVGAFQTGGKQITDFFGGLPRALSTIGGQMVDGLVGGLRDAWDGLTSTLHDLAMKLPEPVRKALGIASPSKVFHLIGQQVGQGLHRGLLGSVDQIKTTSQKMVDAIMGDKHIGKTLGEKMAAAIRTEAKTLERLSGHREKAANRLADARSHYADVLANRKAFGLDVRSNVMGNADVSSLFMASPTVTAAGMGTLNGAAYQPSWTTSSKAGLGTVKASLKKLLHDTKTFAHNLRALVRAGIDSSTYDELVQAGVRGGGLETSAALLADPTLARSIFSYERQIKTAGGDLGTQAGRHEYAGQVSRARTAVRNDERDVRAINLTMVVEARKIDEVQKLIRMVNHVKPTARKGKRH